MIKFSIPGYCCQQDIVFFFAYLQKNHPEVFIENRYIDSSYDMPPGLIWNGGRVMLSGMSPLDIWDMADEYAELNIKLRHTCTNNQLQSHHLSDVLCNNWINYTHKKGNAVIVNNNMLGSYIQKYYPNYQLVWSTTRTQDDIESVNALSENDLVVLNYNYNHDNNYINQLTHPKNIEILCAEMCVPNCPHRQDHYTAISRHQLWYRPLVDELHVCPFKREDPHISFYEGFSLPHNITNEYIDELYNTFGIENFKISGRKQPPHFLIEAICYYLIKPEYRDLVRQDALSSILCKPIKPE